MQVILTIAGSDSSGGAGIQADLKAISACGGYGASVLTAITAQNTRGVHDAFELPEAIVSAQLDAVFTDLRIAAVKSGMMSSCRVIDVVESALGRWKPAHYVLDPVLVAKSGHPLLDADAVDALRRQLVPLATVVTPNRYETLALTGIDPRRPEDAEKAGRQLLEHGCGAVLVKGGHMDGGGATDVLVTTGSVQLFPGQRIDTPHTHGTGCTLAAAVATYLGRGCELADAVQLAKSYVTEAIRDGIAVGRGHGPTDHFFYLRRRDPLEWIERLRVRGDPGGGAG